MDDTILADRQSQAQAWFRQLRDEICASYEALERCNQSEAAFQRTPWTKNPEETLQGGGEISLMKGSVFEKVGVNISTVYGSFSPQFSKEIPGATDDPRFWACGISLVAHPVSPLVPAAHFNTRMIVVGEGRRLWFGGGGDLNPMIEHEADTRQFHEAFAASCQRFDSRFYPAFRDWCDEYFYIPHRGRTRGVGGIFYDYLGLHTLGDDKTSIDPSQFGKGGVGKEHTRAGMALAADAIDAWEQAFAFTQSVGESFRDIYPEIIAAHMHESWTEAQREIQLIKRGHYAEYNLLYDRGTRFGLMTGGNPDAILMSLPPVAHWP